VPGGQQGAFLDQFGEAVPLGRVAEPDEIGNAAVFLDSSAFSFVAGAELFADGGYTQT
jgi:NAD(P)-dependent dehydrogenase (short-subunit alcohol dehydrogenase family)